MAVNDEHMVGIDIGTTKVTTLIAKFGKNNTFKIKGYGISECRGMKKGLIVDINEATKSILKSVDSAEKSTKTFIDKAFIGITGKHISFINNWSETSINSPNHLIRKIDVDRLLTQANKVNLSSSNEIVHTLIKQFVIDDEKGIIDPIGLSARKLAVELLAVYGSSSQISNIVNSIKNSKIEVQDIILEALASSEAVLTSEEKESGVILLDIGGGTTEVAVISLKSVVFCRSVRVGGDEMDRAIVQYVKRKYNLLIGERTSEQIKIEIGSALLEGDMNKKSIAVKGRDLVTGVPKTVMLTSPEVNEALLETVASIIDVIRVALENTPPELSADLVDRGITMAGGGSLLKGLDKLISKETGLPVHVADDPLFCVVNGAGKVLEQFDFFKDALME